MIEAFRRTIDQPAQAGRLQEGQLLFARRAYGVGAISFGLINLLFENFALQYQPVPASLPITALAPASALILCVGGVLLLLPRFAVMGATLLAVWFLSWILCFHLPRIPWDTLTWGPLLPGAEILAIASGAALLAVSLGAFGRVWDAVWLRLFGLAQIVFGACHFVFVDITASMVPAYLPGAYLLAVLTGVAHLAAAISMLTAYKLRLSGALLCLMYTGFFALVCVPILLQKPGAHLPWLMCVITALHAVSAWAVSLRASDLQPSNLRDRLSMSLSPASGRDPSRRA